MIERILKRFAYVKALMAEIERMKNAFESADRYADALEQQKLLHERKISDLLATNVLLNNKIDERDREIVELKRHLSGGTK